MSWCLLSEARVKAVCPLLSLRFVSAPCSSRSLTIAVFPLLEAVMSAVRPWLSVALI